MARTSFAQVEKLVEIDSSITTDAAEFIETANALVTELCEPATKADGTLYHDATRLELIERWLSCHFYCVRDPRPVMEKAGSVAAQYQSKVDLNLSTSHYGQQAMLLDTSGALSAWNEQSKKGSKKKLGLNWGGKAYEDQEHVQ